MSRVAQSIEPLSTFLSSSSNSNEPARFKLQVETKKKIFELVLEEEEEKVLTIVHKLYTTYEKEMPASKETSIPNKRKLRRPPSISFSKGFSLAPKEKKKVEEGPLPSLVNNAPSLSFATQDLKKKTVLDLTKFLEACESGNLDEVKRLWKKETKLIEQADDRGWIGLHWACNSRRLKVCRFLLKKGANPNQNTNLSQNNPLHFLAKFIPSNKEEEALLLEVLLLMIEKCIEINAVNVKGQTPLHAASALGAERVARFLLDHKASLSISTANESETPLMYAIRYEQERMVRLLLEANSPLDCQEPGKTALTLCKELGGREKITKLIAKYEINGVKNEETDHKTEKPSEAFIRAFRQKVEKEKDGLAFVSPCSSPKPVNNDSEPHHFSHQQQPIRDATITVETLLSYLEQDEDAPSTNNNNNTETSSSSSIPAVSPRSHSHSHSQSGPMLLPSASSFSLNYHHHLNNSNTTQSVTIPITEKQIWSLTSTLAKNKWPEEKVDQSILNELFCLPREGFYLEIGSKQAPLPSSSNSSQLFFLEDLDFDLKFYSFYFANREHLNYYGEDDSVGDIMISIEQEGMDPDASSDPNTSSHTPPPSPPGHRDHHSHSHSHSHSQHGNRVHKAIVRTKGKDERLFVSGSTEKERLKHLISQQPLLSNVKLSKPIQEPEMVSQLTAFEEKMLNRAYKFGILYARAGQKEENEMFHNQTGSEDFHQFIEFLGNKIPLKGWTKFRGGLDVARDQTGTHSIYANWPLTMYTRQGGIYETMATNTNEDQAIEIMFHVSTLLPYNNMDPQQLEKKRHIGNDVVIIIFRDGDENGSSSRAFFDPLTIKSQFNHVWILVSVERKEKNEVFYRVNVVNKFGVKPNRPHLPNPPVFAKDEYFRQWLLTKMVNSERAAMYAPDFRAKKSTVRRAALKEIVAFAKSTGKKSLLKKITDKK